MLTHKVEAPLQNKYNSAQNKWEFQYVFSFEVTEELS